MTVAAVIDEITAATIRVSADATIVADGVVVKAGAPAAATAAPDKRDAAQKAMAVETAAIALLRIILPVR